MSEAGKLTKPNIRFRHTSLMRTAKHGYIAIAASLVATVAYRAYYWKLYENLYDQYDAKYTNEAIYAELKANGSYKCFEEDGSLKEF